MLRGARASLSRASQAKQRGVLSTMLEVKTCRINSMMQLHCRPAMWDAVLQGATQAG
jgi:hypothetical protein